MRNVLVALLVVLAVAGCTSSRTGPAPTTRTVVTGTTTITSTRTAPAPTSGAVPATSVAPFPTSGSAPAGEVQRTCPYIKAGVDSEPTSGPNIADLEGNRVGRVTVLTRYNPVGCRFYFSYSYGETDHQAVADILPFTFATATAARNAMIATATAGTGVQTERDFVPGLTGIRFRTRFFGPDGPDDWAFVFSKGRRMVLVHSQQTNASLNPQRIAAAIAARF